MRDQELQANVAVRALAVGSSAVLERKDLETRLTLRRLCFQKFHHQSELVAEEEYSDFYIC